VRDDIALDNALSSLSDKHVILHYCKAGKDVVDAETMVQKLKAAAAGSALPDAGSTQHLIAMSA